MLVPPPIPPKSRAEKPLPLSFVIDRRAIPPRLPPNSSITHHDGSHPKSAGAPLVGALFSPNIRDSPKSAPGPRVPVSAA